MRSGVNLPSLMLFAAPSSRFFPTKIFGVQCRRTERFTRRPVDHEPKVDVVVGKIHQVLGSKYRLKLARNHMGVFGAGTERYERANVAEHRMLYVGAQDELALAPRIRAHR